LKGPELREAVELKFLVHQQLYPLTSRWVDEMLRFNRMSGNGEAVWYRQRIDECRLWTAHSG